MALRAPKFFASVALLAVSISSACASGGDGMQEKLYDATRQYNKALRWSDFDRAAAFVPAEAEDRFLDEHQALDEELVVLDYELTRLKLEKQDGIASCRVRISWHTDRNLVVRETMVDQVWQFYKGAWFLVDEFRAQGDPLAIFAEKGEAMDLDHPYLPGLEDFRDARDIGLSDDEKRMREKARRKAQKDAEKAAAKGEASAAQARGREDYVAPLPEEKRQLSTSMHGGDL